MVKKRTLKKLLVANRGEIALRIIRGARVLGLKTVAVYSEPDAKAAHVVAADEARLIGPAEPRESYLNIGAIIGAAKASGADAIHPGYGFLSERPEFARACEEAGLVFVGPPADVMAAMGDKVAARRLAVRAGVPVVPGVEAGDFASARSFAAEAGFPILVKAAAGGGGRGMRVVESYAELEAGLEAAAREAEAAFGDGRVFLEKYLARPRHVEVQLLADEHGGAVTLGERECSIQRRHQKVIEESPAPGLSEATRARMLEAALKLARLAGYRNAGTVEFLLDGEDFYFLEVNARLQVEHPVTEMRFGCDLVCEQLRVAAGERVTEPGTPRGCAIECRIYAEDPEHDFRPATGKVAYLNFPSGPGVRIDSHLTSGLEVTSYYDGLLAKLICWGENREEARWRAVLALGEFALVGVINTAAFLREVVEGDAFRRGELSTHFLQEFFKGWRQGDDGLQEALIGAALVAQGVLRAARAAGDGSRESVRPGAGEALRSPWTELGGFEFWRRG
jgi:acetyl/propionyl-CoA carboxylase alpha subunit